MPTPTKPLVAEMVAKLSPALREDFEERAAIMEFDAELPRDYAECLALLDVLNRHPCALCPAAQNQPSYMKQPKGETQ